MKRTLLAWLSAGVLIAMHVRAEGEPLELEWNAPKGCPSQEDVLTEVRRIVGSGEVRRHVHAIAHVSGDGARWSLALQTEEAGAGGERTLEGHSCKAVASAAALVLALTLQTDPVPVPSATASVSAPPTSRAPASPPPTSKPRISPLLRAGGGVSLSGVPGVAGVGTAELGVRYGRFEGDLTFAFLSETSQSNAADPLVGGKFAQVALGAIGCIAPVVGTEKPGVEVWGCAGGEVQWMLAGRYGPKDKNDTTADEATYAYFAPTISPRLTFAPIRRVAFVLASTFSFPVERPAFGLLCPPFAHAGGSCRAGELQRIFRVPPAGLRVTLAVELRF